MNSSSAEAANKLVLQSTQDATKWNECLSSCGFGMMTKTFFDPQMR